MSKLSKSPQRNTFQRDNYLKEQALKGRTPDNDKEVQDMVECYSLWEVEKTNREDSPEWSEHNMEFDLRTTDWILEKVRASEAYAQNLYAVMCNNEFQQLDTYPILANKTWGCSWRYAGGIIADMRQSGDYIDWYCSGMGDNPSYVSESTVTEEIEDDLQRLGWRVIRENE